VLLLAHSFDATERRRPAKVNTASKSDVSG